MNKDDKFQVIATKVSANTKMQIGRLCKAKGLTEYEMLQMMCDCLIRYMDDRHNLNPELEKAMSIFEHMTGWKDAYNICDPTAKPLIEEAVYITSDESGKKYGLRAHMVKKPFLGQWEQTDNVVTIYERLTEVLMPDIYRKLRLLAVTQENSSIVELMHALIDAQTDEEYSSEYRKEFEDANRADNTLPYEYGQRTKRKHKRDIEIAFTDKRLKK